MNLKQKLLEEEESLYQEQKALGYGNISSTEFLKLEPDLSGEQSTVANLIDLQKRTQHLQKEKTTFSSEEEVVRELNRKHAVVHTDRYYILTEKQDLNFGGVNFSLESKQSFKDMYENQIVQLGKGKILTKANIWLKSEMRRQYDGIIFHPKLDNCKSKYYNIWKGFAVTPKKGNCNRYKTFVKEVICSKSEQYFDYLWKWCARLIQKPHKLGEVSPVLLGEQGTGKNTFVNALGKLVGGHYLPLDNIHQLLGTFNFHLKNAVFIHANEAIWGGNRKEIGKLKALITEQHKIIEGKGKDSIVVPNFTHLVISSNEEWPVHLDRDDRRFFILRVSSAHKEDTHYFKETHNELENGGYEALLYDLLHENIEEFDPRVIPHNIEAFSIKMQSSESCEKYLYEALRLGCFDIGNQTPTETWPQQKSKNSVFIDYQCWCAKEGLPQKENATLGKTLNKLIPSIGSTRPGMNGDRVPCYLFPPIEQARKEFEAAFKANDSIWQ